MVAPNSFLNKLGENESAWIVRRVDDNIYLNNDGLEYRCFKCGSENPGRGTLFCPHCGRRMAPDDIFDYSVENGMESQYFDKPVVSEAPPSKIITVKLSLDPIDGTYDSDDLIASDIEQELSCCWHLFDVLSIEILNEKGANHAE